MKLSKAIVESFVARSFVRKMSLEPPRVENCVNLNRDDFKKEIKVPTINFKKEKVNINNMLKPLKKFLLKRPQFTPVQEGKIYLNPDLITDFSQLPASELKKEGIDESCFNSENITFTYDNWITHELVKAIIPIDIEPCTSYSRIGHIIHFNFRDEHLPYKMPIAEIYFDKTPGVRTVINKADMIDNTYRNFQIELLKGEADYQVQVKENGSTFEFDFSQVFWNPRLVAEHQRLVNMLNANDILYDVFAGVGPFSIPAGKKRVQVLANDLNPHSYKWLENNVKKNKVTSYVKTFNKDGRNFIIEDVRKDLIERIKTRENDPVEYSIHIAMNLPALSATFLDAFVGLLRGHENTSSLPTPVCHCYCFVKGDEDPSVMAQTLAEENLGLKLSMGENLKEISFVRKVSNNKYMMRIDILLTADILLREGKKRSNDSVIDENSCKKKCIDHGKEQEEAAIQQ